jgi:hypothetical protein
MLYQPPEPPRPWWPIPVTIMLIFLAVPALWAFIRGYFWVIAWAGEIAMRHHWL